MKYGSYLNDRRERREGGRKAQGEKSIQGFEAVCVLHIMAEWLRDRYDCLWDGGDEIESVNVKCGLLTFDQYQC